MSLKYDKRLINRLVPWRLSLRTSLAKLLVTIYSRPGCHLCEEAKTAILSGASPDDFDLQEVNIDEDPRLAERYRDDVPVVLMAG